MAIAVAARTARRRGERESVVVTRLIVGRIPAGQNRSSSAGHIADRASASRIAGSGHSLSGAGSRANADGHGAFGGRRGREGVSVGFFVRLGLLCGEEWEYLPQHRIGVEGLLPLLHLDPPFFP